MMPDTHPVPAGRRRRPGTIPVSVVIPTRNEAANIVSCLQALDGFDQVVVADSASSDATAALARQRGADVIEFHWDGKYPKKKEWSLHHEIVRHDWVLMLDADEIMTAPLKAEIAALMENGPRHAGYFIEGRFVFLGTPLRFGHRNCKIMLVDRRRTRFPHPNDLDVPGGWEVEGHYQPILDGSVGRLRHALIHWDRKTLSAWFSRHDLYADWEAHMMQRGEHEALAATDTPRRRKLKALFRAIPCRGLVAFLHSYVFKFGFLDGSAGLNFAIARGLYYWQIAMRRREQKVAAPALPGGVPQASRGR